MSQRHTTQPTGRSFARSHAMPDISEVSLGFAINETAAAISSVHLARLLGGVSDRDQPAFAELYRLTSATLFKTAILIIKRCDGAEDVLQQSYVDIWQKAATFDASLHLPINWMNAIVRKRAIGQIRRGIEPRHHDFGPALPIDSRTSPRLNDPLSDIAAAACLVGGAAADRRKVISMAYLHGESREQLSVRLGVPVGAVKALLRQALLELDAVPE
ncbi:sigma factor-like helix-turn-helix DNA-binding protein [Tardiphaga sp.]|uniref:sigma factor-like helix-turn-helix DNA-binding protein n=1 Tax=Tardiphaga sp. TaxID=1926292 RepID=UPI0025F25CA2|nr:sigma factor-like helix-turn-helix DNA-binding protein [Tardiphaga sp.]